MALENLVGADKYLGALVITNPVATDDRREGDDHIRGVKNVLKNTFPSLNAAWTGLTVVGGAVRVGLNVEAPAGTEAAPAYSFAGANGTGIWRSGANTLAFSSNGVAALLLGSSAPFAIPVRLIDGTTASPAIGFSSSPGTGLYSPAVNEWALMSNSSVRFRINANLHLLSLLVSTLPTVGNMVNAEMAWSRVSDTQLRVSLRGSDGVLRSATLTLT
jgi:hypothetical protein